MTFFLHVGNVIAHAEAISVLLYDAITELKCLKHFSWAKCNESICFKTTSAVSHNYDLIFVFLLVLPYSPDGAPSQYHYILHPMHYQYILTSACPAVNQWALRKYSGHIIIHHLCPLSCYLSSHCWLYICVVWLNKARSIVGTNNILTYLFIVVQFVRIVPYIIDSYHLKAILFYPLLRFL